MFIICEKHLTIPGHIWPHECDGWYIYSNINNAKNPPTSNSSPTTITWG